MARQDEAPLFYRDGIVYREWAYRLASLEKYPIAEAYFEKAIQQGQHNDLRTYLGLCKLQLDYSRFQRAKMTTEKCIEIDPSYSYVKHMQLETLFHMGEFEYSLVHAHQGYQKYPTVFLEHGIMQGSDTVEDCVGSNINPNALELLSPWIRELVEYRTLLIAKQKEEVDELAGVEEDQPRFKVNQPEARAKARFRSMQRLLAKIYLGYLADDKKFLQDLVEHPEKLESPNKQSTNVLRAIVRRNYKRAVHKQNILRMRRPLYVVLFKHRALSIGYKTMLEAEKKLRRNIIVIEADYLLHRLHEIRMQKDYTTFFRMVERVKDKFDAYSLSSFPMKQKCLHALYNMVAWTYIDTRDLTNIQSRKLKRIYLKHHLGIRVAELPRDCDIAWIRVNDKKEALKTFRRRLAMASDSLELTWIFHELCRHLIDIRRYDLARFYGKKARDMGQESNSEQWILNSQHLFIRIEISQNYRNEAKEAALLALSSSKQLGLNFLVDFYKNALEIIDDMDMEKLLDFDAIAARQQLILNLMPDDMKTEVDFLWRRMEAVPAKRRMSVMPGCKPVDRKFKLPCKRMTIMPTPAKNPEKEARKALLKQYEFFRGRPGFTIANFTVQNERQCSKQSSIGSTPVPVKISMDVLASGGLKDELINLNETRKAVENAESRARFDQKRTDSKAPHRNNREYAQALHREADHLYRSGDYETALVLYHRAANLNPKDSSHGVAARKTAATISSCNNPKALRKVLPGSSTGERLTAALCPETAAIMANEKLRKSPNHSSVTEVLSYLDNHKSYWKCLPIPRISSTQLSRSKMMLKQLNNVAESSLKNLQATFDSGKMSTALKIAQELLVLSGGFRDPTRYQISAYHYLSLIHVVLGRHDRAVYNVSRLVRLSNSTDDVTLICQSFVTLGKVHLSFGHLDAAARAWEHLSKKLKAPIPVSWIRHEIGRCYLETGKYEKAAELAFGCLEAAAKGNSKKWMLNGRLLLGQSLAKLGKFVESLEELQIAAKITEEEGDTPMLSYIRDLIDQVAHALNPYHNSCWEVSQSKISASQKQEADDRRVFIKREETVISAMYSQRKVITERQADSSSDEASLDADGEITIRSDRTISLVQFYRDSAARSDLEEQQNLPEACTTFRMEPVSEEQDNRSSSSARLSSSSSSSDIDDEEMLAERTRRHIVREEDEEEEEEEEEEEIRECNSKVSLRSVNTTATYVIEKESVLGRSKDNEEERKLNEDIETASKSMMYNDKIVGKNEDMLNALRVIEELGKKDEVELLEMLRDMMLTTGEKDRLEDFGNSGDGFRTSRSDDDKQDEIATRRSTRRTSLSLAARICDAHGDFRDC